MEFKPEILQLAALRQSRGVSLESIAEQTKISRYYLRAIEDLDMAKLPQGVYRMNFLIQYARAIDEDIAEELKRKLLLEAKAAREAEESAIANSGRLRAVKEIIARGAALVFLFGTASMSGEAPPNAPKSYQTIIKDPRYQALRNFFEKCGCPLGLESAEFILAADVYGLDWRLVPSIAFLESSGGKYSQGYNPVGWGSGTAQFKSYRHAIHHVTERLARSPIYAG